LFLLQLFVLLPIRTDRSLRAVPYVTYALLFLNTFVHLATLNYSDAELYLFQQHWGLTFGSPTLLNLFTHAFVHGDWTHLLGNMLILWIVGTVLEAGIGSALFSLLYLASLFGAVLLQGLIGHFAQPESLQVPLIGASGAIAGVTGFAAFRYYHIRVQNFIVIPNFFGVPPWLIFIPIPYALWMPFWGYAAYFGGKEMLFGLVQLASAKGDSIAHWAHLGGLGLGLLAALLLRSYHEGQRERALEGSTKATVGEASQHRSIEDVRRLLKTHPDDPELLEAMAGLALVNGAVAESIAFYQRAIPLFLKSGRSDRAAISYLNILHHAPDTMLTLREQLTLASTLEGQGHFSEAAQAFTLLFTRYGEHNEAQTALLRAAYIHDKQLQATGKAGELLNTLLQCYPLSPWAELAKERLQELQRRQPKPQ
jgi:membrane associated rhomboid family serine protease